MWICATRSWGTLFTYSNGIEAVIARGNVDIVDVKQNPAIGVLHNFRQKLPLRHLRGVGMGIAVTFSTTTGTSRKSRASRIFCAVLAAASKVYGMGSKSCE